MAERKPLFLSAEGWNEEMAPADTATFGGLTLSGAIAMGASKITGLADGVAATDAATKGQVDAAISGLDTKESCRLGTSAALPASTAAGSGIGKTLTADANGALLVDSVAVVVGDRILVKNEVSGVHNGIYTVTATGDGANPWVLTRATDFDQDAEVTASAYTFVSEGTVNADSGWTVTTDDPITVDTTALSWAQFNGLGQVTAGAGLSKTGQTMDVNAGDGIAIVSDRVTVDMSATPGLEFTGTTPNAELQVLVDPNGGIERVAAGIGAKLNGTTLQKAAAGLSVKGLPSLFEINAVAVGATVTAANLDTLTDGSNADALHSHTAGTSSQRLENSLPVGSAVAVGDPVYWTATSDRLAPTDAGSVVTTRPIGVAITAQAVVGSNSSVVSNGTAIGVLTAATPGTRYYMAVGGGLTSTRPVGTGNRVVQMGYARTATDLWVEIQDYGRVA